MEDRPATHVWGSFQHDRRDPAVAPLRASDADRDVVHGVLTEAFADGRLDREEHDERELVAAEVRRSEGKQARAVESQQARRSDP